MAAFIAELIRRLGGAVCLLAALTLLSGVRWATGCLENLKVVFYLTTDLCSPVGSGFESSFRTQYLGLHICSVSAGYLTPQLLDLFLVSQLKKKKKKEPILGVW